MLIDAVQRAETAVAEMVACARRGDATTEDMRVGLERSKALLAMLAVFQAAAAATTAVRERHGDGGAGVLRHATGVSRRQAEGRVRTARVLDDLPLVRDALEAGKVSFANAARLAEASEAVGGAVVQADGGLLSDAESMSDDQFAREARRWTARHRSDGGEADYARRRARRWLRIWDGDDGMTQLRGELDPVTGERIRNRLEAEARRLRGADGRDERRSFAQAMADALDGVTTVGSDVVQGRARQASGGGVRGGDNATRQARSGVRSGDNPTRQARSGVRSPGGRNDDNATGQAPNGPSQGNRGDDNPTDQARNGPSRGNPTDQAPNGDRNGDNPTDQPPGSPSPGNPNHDDTTDQTPNSPSPGNRTNDDTTGQTRSGPSPGNRSDDNPTGQPPNGPSPGNRGDDNPTGQTPNGPSSGNRTDDDATGQGSDGCDDRNTGDGCDDRGGGAGGGGGHDGDPIAGSVHRGRPIADIAVVAYVDSDTGDLVSQLATGEPLPPSVLEMLACNSSITGILYDTAGTPLWRGTTKRTATAAQLKALIARDGGCVGCGCHPALCQAHHIKPASQGGPTTIANMVLLCWHCHHKVHHHQWTVTRRHGRFGLLPPVRTRSGPARAPDPPAQPVTPGDSGQAIPQRRLFVS